MQGIGLAAVNQVDKTMVKLGHHNQRARPVRGVDNLPVHLEFFGHGRKFFVQRRAIQLILRTQSDTHEEQATVASLNCWLSSIFSPLLQKFAIRRQQFQGHPTRRVTINFASRNPIRFRCDKRNFRRFCQSGATGWWPADIWVRSGRKTPGRATGRHPGRGRKKSDGSLV